MQTERSESMVILLDGEERVCGSTYSDGPFLSIYSSPSPEFILRFILTPWLLRHILHHCRRLRAKKFET
jgi:hypothetical protein